jgi:hypothetical protein
VMAAQPAEFNRAVLDWLVAAEAST